VPRPNKGTDLLLLETGKRILLNEGISSLTISAICKKAHVNPGMFVYNFKSKEEFLNRILLELHDELFGDEPELESLGSGYDGLYKSLYFLCVVCARYPKLMAQCGSDTLSGDETLIKTFQKRTANHMKKIFPFFKKAQEEGTISRKIGLPEFLLLVWPTLMYSSISPSKIMKIVPEEDKKDPMLMISDQAIRERVRKCLRIFHPDVYEHL
jgi:AcrR family transcriptional regulator